MRFVQYKHIDKIDEIYMIFRTGSLQIHHGTFEKINFSGLTLLGQKDVSESNLVRT